ncbi:MAG: ketol-acid reductoisomerase [Halobacteria archaeon]
MAKSYSDADASLDPLKGKTVAFVGYGSQGRHQALNMKDSGLKVLIGLRNRSSPSWAEAERDGFEATLVDDAAKRADLVILISPDETHEAVYRDSIHPHMKAGKTLGVSHAFSVYYGLVLPPKECDVVMIAPKAPGPTVRREFQNGFGVPCLVAVHQDASGKALQTALAWAKAIGSTRAGVLRTTFKEEVETDHFGEIAVLCGGTAELVKAGFDTLVEAGYQPEAAYFECLHELKLIVDLIQEGGIEHMWDCVSTTAEYGGRLHGKSVVTADTRKRMGKILKHIQSGNYAKELIAEQRAGMPTMKRMRDEERNHPLERVGADLRKMMKRQSPAKK